jgi:prepilin-type processing-associated H-X9-DG protein
MSASLKKDPEFSQPVQKGRARRPFTLDALLVAVGIIAFLIGLIPLPTACDWPRARRAECTNRLKQIGLALLSYEQAHGVLPPAYTVDATGRPLHSWRTLILPYLGHEPLYRSIDLSKPWNDPANAQALQTSLPVFLCPESRGRTNTTTYLAIAGPRGCLRPRDSRRLAEITDPHTSTFMVIEATENYAIPWMAPSDADESLVSSLGPDAKLHHAGGMNACFVDGRVQFLKANTPVAVRRALMSIDGNDNGVDDELP